MRPRLELKVKTTLSTRTGLRTRLVFAGSTIAMVCLVGVAVFMYGNLGNVQNTRAALATNLGFENGTFEWSAISGTWTSNTTAAYVRSGTKSIKVNATNGSGKDIGNPLSTITVPLAGTYYIAVTAHGKGSDGNGKLQCGVANSLLGTMTMGGNSTSLSSNSFTKVTAIIPVSNGVTYYPVLTAKRSGNGSTDVYVDDVHMYLTTSNTADATNPNTPTSFAINAALGVLSYNFTDGSDAGSGTNGILILRQAGVQTTNATLNSGVAYSTNALVGPTTVGTWSVVFNGSSASAGDAPGSGVFTYLVFQKDKAGNFSTNPARLLVLNNTGLSQSLSSNLAVDGLYLPAGSSLTVGSGYTLTINSGSTVIVNGTINMSGTLTNNGSLTFATGSEYNHNRNGGAVATVIWKPASVCNVVGATTTSPNGLNQTFANFNWNCAGQTTSMNFPAAFSTAGDFTLTSTGASSKNIKLFGDTHIGGNFSQAAGALVAFDPNHSLYFDGTSEQTIAGTNLSFNAVHFANDGMGVKLLNDLTISDDVYLDNGNVNLNNTNLYTLDECTLHRSAGSMTNGTLAASPSDPTGTYNLEYTSACTTGIELTSTAGYLHDVTIDGAASDMVTLDKNASVNGSLVLTAGKIKTTSNYVVHMLNTDHNAVQYEEQDGYVFGSLRWNVSGNNDYDFPVGSSNFTQNVVLKLHNIVGVSYITVTFNPTLLGAAPNPLQCIANGTPINTLYNAGYWSIHPDNQPTSGTYEVKIKGKGGSNPPASAMYGNVLKRSNSAAAWAALGTQDNVNNTLANGKLEINVKDLTSFSDFGIGYGNTVLPITLSAFVAEVRENESVQLYWKTSAELNNAKFVLERSSDGTSFEPVNEQPGAGTSTQAHAYEYLDKSPLRGVNYYRLKQIDFDGNFTYSPIRPVEFGETQVASEPLSFTVYPNPSSGMFNINRNTKDSKTNSSVDVHDVKGQLVMQLNFNANQPIQIDLTALPPGAYMATLRDANNRMASQQLVVQR